MVDFFRFPHLLVIHEEKRRRKRNEKKGKEATNSAFYDFVCSLEEKKKRWTLYHLNFLFVDPLERVIKITIPKP
jgi:hypothetical protein